MTDKTRYVCSKMFKDVNIKFPYEVIKHCCKSNDVKVSLEEVKQLDNVLVQTDHYMSNKRSMVDDNKLPAGGCDSCIYTEPNSLFRSWNQWRHITEYTDDQKTRLMNDDNFNYYEFVLSTDCDLKCVYCGSKDSSSWAKELGEPKRAARDEWKKLVEDKVIDNLRSKTYNVEHETYFFSFSGGEPTYNIEMIDFIKRVLEVIPKSKSVINLSTNLNTKARIFDRFLELIDANPDIQFTVDCSFEDIKQRCEAIRTGLIWDRAMSNMDKLFLRNNIEVHIAATPNMYSLPYTLEFIKFFVEKFKAAGKFMPEGHNPKNELLSMYTMFSHNMVQDEELSPRSMPAKYRECLTPAIEYCYENGIDKYAGHLERIQGLIGSALRNDTSEKVKRKFDYFKLVRPEYDWDGLFPHVNDIIEETKC